MHDMNKVLFFDMYQTLADTQIGDKKELVENGYTVVFADFLISEAHLHRTFFLHLLYF